MVLGSVGRDYCKKNRVFEFLTKSFRLRCLSVFKGFDVFIVIRLKGEVDFLIGKYMGVFHFPRALVIVAKSFEKGFWCGFISTYAFPVIPN